MRGLDFAELKPSIGNVLLFFLMWVAIANFAKYAFNKFPVPGLTQLVNNA